MAICCYCKFKPPKEDNVEYHFDITGQSTTGAKHKMSVPIENLSTQRENMGGMGHNVAGDGPVGGYMHGHSAHGVHGPDGNTQFRSVNTESHHAVAEYTPASAEEAEMYGHGPTGRGKLNRSGSNATTGSATSDEDVLKGAYGGHITAGGDDPFPRDKQRSINDNLYTHHNNNHNGMNGVNVVNGQRMITPIDMHGRESDRGLESESSEEDYEDDEDYYEDDDDDVYGDNGGHQTIGAPIDHIHHNYPHNRHHVDGDEQYIVEMITKDELRRKVEDDLKDKERNALRNKDQEYATNLNRGHQENMDIMDDVINEIAYDGDVNNYVQNGQRHYGYYHQ